MPDLNVLVPAITALAALAGAFAKYLLDRWRFSGSVGSAHADTVFHAGEKLRDALERRVTAAEERTRILEDRLVEVREKWRLAELEKVRLLARIELLEERMKAMEKEAYDD